MECGFDWSTRMHRHLHEPKLPENCLEHFAGKNHLPFGLYLAILLFCYRCGLWILKKFLSHNLECIVYAQQGIRRFTFQTIHHKKNAELKLTQQKRPKEPNCIFFILRLNIFKLHLTEECYIYRSSRIQDGGNLPVVCADRQCVYMT